MHPMRDVQAAFRGQGRGQARPQLARTVVAKPHRLGA